MGEELRLAPSCGLQPLPRPDWVASQSFELLHGPSDEMLVDALGYGVQHRAVEAVGRIYSIASLTCDDASVMV
jgi:hypothetical protein